MNSTAPTGWDAFQAIIDAGRKYNLPAPNTLTDGRVYVNGWRDVLAWAKALDGEVRIYDGRSRDGGGAARIQAAADLPRLGLGRFFDVVGSAECDLGDVAHEHETCVEQARAEWAALGELVQA
jgi:hypothetical protein